MKIRSHGKFSILKKFSNLVRNVFKWAIWKHFLPNSKISSKLKINSIKKWKVFYSTKAFYPSIVVWIGHLKTFLTQFENFFKIENFPWERIFMLAHWFLIQKKAQDVYFEMKKFFTPTKSFLPPFLLMHYHHEKDNFNSIVRYPNCYRGG